MTQTALVRSVLPHNKVRLSIVRESACGHDCTSCGGCSMSEKREVYVVANDPLGVNAGDTVVVESSTKKLLSIAALVYLLPIVLFFAVYLLASGLGIGETLSSVAAVGGFLVGILVAVVCSRRERQKGSMEFTVISVKR